jgi:hypothetical protein
MTRRERKEARIARRLEWAAGRDRKAAQGFNRARSIADGIPLGQAVLVGHHSEGRHRRDLDRIDSGMRQGIESQDMAAHHRSKADGIQHQLDTSIFSDDADAPERLRERIAGLEADRDRQKAANQEIKKGPGWEARLAASSITLTDRDKSDLLAVARHQPYLADKRTGLPVFPAYHFQNLGSNIRRLKERLAQIGARRAPAQESP